MYLFILNLNEILERELLKEWVLLNFNLDYKVFKLTIFTLKILFYSPIKQKRFLFFFFFPGNAAFTSKDILETENVFR